MTSIGRTLWTPPPDVRETTQMGRFASWVEARRGIAFDDYQGLWQWSVDDLADFWSSVWEFFDIPFEGSREPALVDATMPFAQWYPDARLNYAEAILRLPGRTDDDVVVRARSDTRPDQDLTASQLREQVGRVRAGLRELGISRGDRVAAYIPNLPEAVVLMLATVSLGAIYTSCPPEFGVTNVIDRWSQIKPSLVVAVDGYMYGGKAIHRGDEVAAIVSALGLEDRLVSLPYLYPDGKDAPSGRTWSTLLSHPADLAFERVPFDHPLWILFTSGTTGAPKPIVHGHGGIVLEYFKLHGLHHDLDLDDTFFWFSTTGWVMWNFLVSSLVVGTTIVLYDGNPGNREMGELWKIAGDFRVTYLGLGAPFVVQCRQAGVVPADFADLSHVREVGSTGAPLTEDGFDWIYEHVGSQIRINSTSGGTDVATAFVGGAPLLPVRSGEIAGRQLGCRVESWNEDGKPVADAMGEMVVTSPMPSMPVCLWGDESGSRYRSAYFDRWPGIWRHGDWITIYSDGHCVIHGRSDATLNRGGVRLGTAEFYRVLEDLDDVADSLVVHLESTDGDAGELVMFVVPAAGREFDNELKVTIKRALSAQLSPRHVPDSMHGIGVVPRTLSGKKLEIPVKRILLGADPDAVADAGSLADPWSLEQFVAFRRIRS